MDRKKGKKTRSSNPIKNRRKGFRGKIVNMSKALKYRPQNLVLRKKRSRVKVLKRERKREGSEEKIRGVYLRVQHDVR